jgi:hypothetical protein
VTESRISTPSWAASKSRRYRISDWRMATRNARSSALSWVAEISIQCDVSNMAKTTVPFRESYKRCLDVFTLSYPICTPVAQVAVRWEICAHTATTRSDERSVSSEEKRASNIAHLPRLLRRRTSELQSYRKLADHIYQATSKVDPSIDLTSLNCINSLSNTDCPRQGKFYLFSCEVAGAGDWVAAPTVGLALFPELLAFSGPALTSATSKRTPSSTSLNAWFPS